LHFRFIFFRGHIEVASRNGNREVRHDRGADRFGKLA
jgi:hypothetical protein